MVRYCVQSKMTKGKDCEERDRKKNWPSFLVVREVQEDKHKVLESVQRDQSTVITKHNKKSQPHTKHNLQSSDIKV